MRRRFSVGLACVLLGWGLLSCTTSTESSVLACSDPSIATGGGVLLSVGTGTAPRFSWSPVCKAYSLVVTDSSGATMWGVISDSGNTLTPSVDYGVLPAGPHTQIQSAVALQAGKLYAVGLYRQYVTTPTPSDVLGAVAFRP
ncbi:MAG: hypothetical protein ACHQU1_08540 [Gemmatimonadales bacterium]